MEYPRNRWAVVGIIAWAFALAAWVTWIYLAKFGPIPERPRTAETHPPSDVGDGQISRASHWEIVNPPSDKTAEIPARGEIRIATAPVHASIRMENGTSRMSPAVFTDQKVGWHLLQISHPDYEPLDLNVKVKANQVVDLGEVRLIRGKGNLKISSWPDGDTYELFHPELGKRTGAIPTTIRGLSPGVYTLTLKRAGWFPYQQDVRIRANTTAFISWMFDSTTRITPQAKLQIENRGKALVAGGDYEAAAEQYRILLSADPYNELNLSNLGVVRVNQNRLEEAEASLKAALNLNPDDAYTLTMLGIVQSRKELYDAAIATFLRSIHLDPTDPLVYYYLGVARMKKQDLPGAEKELLKAIVLKPQYPEAHYSLATLFMLQKPQSIELARLHYKEAIGMGMAHDPKLEEMLKASGRF